MQNICCVCWHMICFVIWLHIPFVASMCKGNVLHILRDLIIIIVLRQKHGNIEQGKRTFNEKYFITLIPTNEKLFGIDITVLMNCVACWIWIFSQKSVASQVKDLKDRLLKDRSHSNDEPSSFVQEEDVADNICACMERVFWTSADVVVAFRWCS